MAASRKLPVRARELLTLIDESTRIEDGEETCFWMPRRGSQWSDRMHRSIYVHGSGDAATLKALERRGLIEPRRFDYSYAITAAGKAEIAAHPAPVCASGDIV